MNLEDGLNICKHTALILKDQFPNDLMKIKDNTIIYHSTKNSRLLGGKKRMGTMSNRYAHFDNKKKRVVLTQKYLINPIMLRTKIKNQSDRVMLYGNFALIELMCHELAHYKTKGHAKGFKKKYNKFLSFMTNWIISGNFYNNYDVL